jgi:sulfur relay protein TusB/DsrH
MAAAATRCLHLLTGASREALEDCLAHAAAGDTVLFIDAGVLQLLRARSGALGSPGVELCFAEADLAAQGLVELARQAQVDVIDDAAFCALLQAHGHCLTWT